MGPPQPLGDDSQQSRRHVSKTKNNPLLTSDLSKHEMQGRNQQGVHRGCFPGWWFKGGSGPRSIRIW
ncbi:hypothetical protein Y1Q_0004521 [Alligator mississippiensis]|uniref:Uncharacterized protein n=1 Tax=Alligator mississippiensis TaxID=8496 RepID=A0A151MAL7_ALLMI|nr:hypothetical protein Y1Q_0004521 [Alligator mississippiensis]